MLRESATADSGWRNIQADERSSCTGLACKVLTCECVGNSNKRPLALRWQNHTAGVCEVICDECTPCLHVCDCMAGELTNRSGVMGQSAKVKDSCQSQQFFHVHRAGDCSSKQLCENQHEQGQD